LMPLADYEELDLTGLDIDGWKKGYAVIRHNLGEGVRVKARVASTHGLWSWTLSSDAQPDRDESEINSLTRFEYYRDFFQRFTSGDSDAFVIDFRGKKWTVGFTDVEESGDMFTYDLFNSQGVNIEQVVVLGETDYDTDGSLGGGGGGGGTDDPEIPTGLRGTPVSPTELLIEWDES